MDKHNQNYKKNRHPNKQTNKKKTMQMKQTN